MQNEVKAKFAYAASNNCKTKPNAHSLLSVPTAKKTSRQHIRNAARSISECVASSASDEDEQPADDNDDANANAKANVPVDNGDDDDADDDMELLSAIADDEYEGFTTLSQLNETQPTVTDALKMPNITASGAAGAAAAIDVNVVASMPKTLAVQHQSSMQNLLTSDDRSQHLSDIDNESFNSIDFDAEITIAGVREQQTDATATAIATTMTTATATGTNEPAESTPDATTIGTFFNNLLSHSNAGESFMPIHNYIVF